MKRNATTGLITVICGFYLLQLLFPSLEFDLGLIRGPVNGHGGVPSGGRRAMREKPEIRSTIECSAPEDLRSHAARVALDTALGSQAAAALRQAVVTTSDGYTEIWQRANFITPYFLVSSTCPNPG